MRNPDLYLAFVRGPEGVMVELVQHWDKAGPEGGPSGGRCPGLGGYVTGTGAASGTTRCRRVLLLPSLVKA